MRIGDLRFDGGVFGSDPVFNQLTGVGKSRDNRKAYPYRTSAMRRRPARSSA
jgi:hypothetical protein